MVTVFIVDDEEIIREGLKNIIPWESIGMQVIGTAENGEDAFEMIKIKRPDVVLSDIRMASMDGLTLINKLRLIMPDIKFIIITGYDEFDYARQALRLDVKDFLSKPVEQDKLMECVLRVRNLAIQEKQELFERKAIDKHLRESLPFMKTWFLNSLERTNTDDGGLYEKLKFFGVNLDKELFQVVIVSIDDMHESAEPGNQYIQYEVYRKLKILLNSLNVNFIHFFEDMFFTIILSYPDGNGEKAFLKKNFEISSIIKEFLEYNLNGYFTIGIGEVVNQLSNIILSYKGAVDACIHKFYLGENQIIFIHDIEPVKKRSDYNNTIIENWLIPSVKIGDKSKVEEILEKLFKEMKESREEISSVKRICLNLIIYVSKAIYELGEKQETFFSKTDPWEQINSFSTLEQLHEYIYSTVIGVIGYLDYKRKTKNQRIIEKAKEIIDNNFTKNVTLESVAESVYLSPVYLSSLFSKEMSTTFKDYLILCRINKAKELLKDINLKIYEVSERSGYTDSHYFSQIFKKYTGLTPIQYRNQLI